MEKHPSPPTRKGPAATFTGDVFVDGIADGGDPSRLVAAHVQFTPGARTHWHSHALGQTLHCTAGVGFVGTRDGRVLVLGPGETIWTPPGEEHWHGGTMDHLMCHLARGTPPPGSRRSRRISTTLPTRCSARIALRAASTSREL